MREYEWGLDLAKDLYDIPGTTMVFIGTKGHQTKVHLDWTRAKNWAVALDSVRYKIFFV